jgi:hypothetical protein
LSIGLPRTTVTIMDCTTDDGQCCQHRNTRLPKYEYN